MISSIHLYNEVSISDTLPEKLLYDVAGFLKPSNYKGFFCSDLYCTMNDIEEHSQSELCKFSVIDALKKWCDKYKESYQLQELDKLLQNALTEGENEYTYITRNLLKMIKGTKSMETANIIHHPIYFYILPFPSC